MTDKQVIIDVTQCPYHKEDKICTYLPYKSKCEGDCNWTVYKEMEEQLKRKEQECEELKDLADHNGRVCNERLDKIDELEHDINELNEQLDQLKAENEELKKYKDVVDKLAGMQVILTNEEKMPMLYDNAKDLKLKQLSKTLIEIKEIAKPYNDMSGNCVIVNFFKDMNEILQKIRKVIPDEKS